MLKDNAALVADADLAVEGAPVRGDAVILDIDDVAQRRERLAAYVQATRPVIVYRFLFPPGAMVAAAGGGEPRDAQNQLYALVGLTGGSVGKSHGGLAARIPLILAPKFEAMAGPLIEAFLVSLDLGDAG